MAVSLQANPIVVDLFFLTLLTIPLLQLLNAPGYLSTHDGLFHLFRLVELDNLWKVGEFYPR
ncbi:MAG TPA: hypothetical protein VKT80_19660, partial [Chloroflexota bacterium]|nr:hypothetical protein [Chloroflexota bacterium]